MSVTITSGIHKKICLQANNKSSFLSFLCSWLGWAGPGNKVHITTDSNYNKYLISP